MKHWSAAIVIAVLLGGLLMWADIRVNIITNRNVSRGIMETINAKTANRYTSMDGERDRAAVDDLRKRVEKLEAGK